ncbi:MAG: DUF2334 domain-containing protein [Lysinibacillus sp.]
MRFKYGIVVIICFLCWASTPLSSEASATEKDVALIYAKDDQRITQDIQALRDMLEAYTHVDVLFTEDVQANTLTRYERVVFMSSNDTEIPPIALQALNSFPGPAVAIGSDALQLAPFATWQEGEEVEIRKIGEQVLERPVRWGSVVPSENVRILQKVSTLTTDYPFTMTEPNRNWSYIGAFIQEMPMPFEWPRMIGELLQLPHPTAHEGFIVLTDINMKTNVEKLKEVVAGFKQYNLPISLEVTPIYEDEKEDVIYYLQDNEKLLEYIQQLQKDDVSIILAASTEHIENSLDYLVIRGIYPTFIHGENIQFTGGVQKHSTQIYKTVRANQTIYPYTVANITNTKDFPLYQVEQSINRLNKAPGAVMGIRYPVFLDASYIQELVELLRAQGPIQWLDFRKTAQHVKTDNVSIVQTVDGKQKVQLSFTYVDRLKKMFDERPFELILWVLVIIVSIFVTIFFMNTLRLRVTLRKRLFEERRSNG